jgi:hypothetical protein
VFPERYARVFRFCPFPGCSWAVMDVEMDKVLRAMDRVMEGMKKEEEREEEE